MVNLMLIQILKRINKNKTFEIREQYLKDENQENIEPTMSYYDSQIFKLRQFICGGTRNSQLKITLKLTTDHEFVKRSIH